MENTLTYEYPQGIWCIDKDAQNIALKFSGNKTIRVPATKEILETIKKQIEANKIFTSFKQLNPEDENIIGYLNLILDDYVNYLDYNNLNDLASIMKQIKQSNKIDLQNATFIEMLRINLETRIKLEKSNQEKSDNLDSFYNIFEQFQTYNKSYFVESYIDNKPSTKTH